MTHDLCPRVPTLLELPDAGEGACCYGAALYGPNRCTCWTPVFDVEQQPLNEQLRSWLAAGIEPVTRARMCGDCAYRPGSPERADHPDYKGDPETLEHLAATGTRFWCHQGMRRPIAWRHPSGVEVAEDSDHSYDPPKVDGVPWRADGTPGELCAGWDARRRALLAGGSRGRRHDG